MYIEAFLTFKVRPASNNLYKKKKQSLNKHKIYN